jgi:hypothetical protein
MKACLEDLLEMDFCTKSPNFGVEPRPSWRCFNDPCLCGVVVMRRVAWLPRLPCPGSSPLQLSRQSVTVTVTVPGLARDGARIARHGGGRATQLLWPSAAARPSVRRAPAAAATAL